MLWSILVIGMTILIAAAVIYDIVLTTDKIEGNTFSELLREYGKKSPIFPWTLSFLAGRWFHPGDKLKPILNNLPDAYTVVLVAVLTAVVVVIGVLYKRYCGAESWIPPWIIVAAGLILGSVVAPVPLVKG